MMNASLLPQTPPLLLTYTPPLMLTHMPTADVLWEHVRKRFEAHLEPVARDMIKTLRFERIEQGVVLLSVATTFLRKWLADTHQRLLVYVWTRAMPEIRQVLVTARDVARMAAPVKAKPILLLAAPTPPKLTYTAVVGDITVLLPPVEDREIIDNGDSLEALQEKLGTRKIRFETILEVVCRETAAAWATDKTTVPLTWREVRTVVKAKGRTRKTVGPRQTAMYLAHHLITMSLPDIARRFGGRDHTTALHSIRKVKNLILNNPDKAAEVRALTRQIYLYALAEHASLQLSTPPLEEMALEALPAPERVAEMA